MKFYSRKLECMEQLRFYGGNVVRLFPDNPSDYELLRAFYLPRWPDMRRQDLNWDYFAVVEDGKIVSLAGAMHMTESNWEIAGVYTLPEYRGKGFARAVCSYAAKHILNSGKCATCNTDINNTAMRKVMDSIGMVEQ